MQNLTNQSYEDAPFLGPQCSICPKEIFSGGINIILIYLLNSFIVQNFKKFFQQIQSYEDAQILGPKQSIPPPPPQKKEIFFRKPI